MLTAHIPSGYLIAHNLPPKAVPTAGMIGVAVIGSLFPDIDMIAFFLLDHGSFHHRHYWTHIPMFWLTPFALVLLALKLAGRRGSMRIETRYLTLFFLGILGHLLVDTYSGPVLWLYPLTPMPFELIEVPATQSHWVLSYILHWSFAAEISLWLGAAATFAAVQQKRGAPWWHASSGKISEDPTSKDHRSG